MPAAMFKPLLPSTLSGCSVIDLSKPPISTFAPDSDADGRLSGHAGIVAFERARCDVGGRRKHAPNDRAAAGVADIDADLGDVADIVLADTTMSACNSQFMFLDEPKHEAPARIDVAGQHADLHARRLRRRP